MKTNTKIARKPSVAKAKIESKEGMAESALHYFEKTYNDLDKAKLARVAGVAAVAVVVIAGAARSSLLKSIGTTILTGAAAKYVSEKWPVVQQAFAKA
jgi:hypothetical protein